MVVVALLYLLGHLVLGSWLCTLLLQAQTPVTAVMVAVTLIVAVGNLFVAAPLWVYAGVALIRGPKAIVEAPTPVSEDELPRIFIQIPGRNEPTDLVVRRSATLGARRSSTASTSGRASSRSCSSPSAETGTPS